MIAPQSLNIIYKEETLYLIKEKNQVAKLIENNESKPVEAIEIIQTIDNPWKNKIWFLVKTSQNQTITNSQQETIAKVAQGLNLNLQKIDIIDSESCSKISFATVSEKTIIDFGQNIASQVKLSPILNSTQSSDGITYLYTSSLEDLQTNQALKISWWKEMKIIFKP